MYLRAHRNSYRSSEDSRFNFFPSPSPLSDVNVDQSKYRRTEGTRACLVERMEGWCSLVYSTPAAARHGIIMSWTNKEKAGEQTCKVTKYRMTMVDGERNRRGISDASKERMGSVQPSAYVACLLVRNRRSGASPDSGHGFLKNSC